MIGRDYGFGLSHKTNIFIKGKYRESTQKENRIGGVMVSILTSSAVDRGFEPQLVQTKDY